jgi:hypothetical protein
MSAYRIYFRIQDNVHGRRNFEADDDVTATRIARVLYDACSDVCDGFELWQGKREIHARQPHHQRANLVDLTEALQNVVLETEEHIRKSRWMIAQSRRLVQILDRSKSAGK